MSFKNFTATDHANIEAEGFSTYNDVPHLCVEVPDGGSTISVKTSDGRTITMHFASYRAGAKPACVDIRRDHDPRVERGDRGLERTDRFQVMTFDNNQRQGITTGLLCVLMDDDEAPQRY